MERFVKRFGPVLLAFMVSMAIFEVSPAATLTTESTTIIANVEEQGVLDVPTDINFQVSDTSSDTVCSSIEVSLTCSLEPGNRARVKLQAASPGFTKPPGAGGSVIPVDKVSWSQAGFALGGVVIPGSLSDTVANTVFESNPDITRASFSLDWRLAAPGPDIAAGSHRLTVIWTLESFTPGN